MKKTLISIDGGMSTGLIAGTFSDTEPFELTHAFQIEGGAEGLVEEVFTLTLEYDDLRSGGLLRIKSRDGRMPYSWSLWEEDHVGCDWGFNEACDEDEYEERHQCAGTRIVDQTVIVAEKFTARGSGNAFSYRTDALEPLRVEGALLAMNLKPVWQSPQSMYFMTPPGFKGNKKSLMHGWLKDHGLYVTGKDVGCKDADDVRSAIIHAIVYLRSINHKPTLEKYFKGEV